MIDTLGASHPRKGARKVSVIAWRGFFNAFFGLMLGACLAWNSPASGLALQDEGASPQSEQEDADKKLLEKWLIWMRPDFRPEAPRVLVDRDNVRDSRLKVRGREVVPALDLELPPLEKPTDDSNTPD